MTNRFLCRGLSCLLLACFLVACTGPKKQGKNNDQKLATRWPIILSHAWSRTADSSFLGEKINLLGEFDTYGIKLALEAEGAVVFQPDKLAYASHEKRGQLLYKKCDGITISDLLCQGENSEVVDGIYQATVTYCADSALRTRSGFIDEASCKNGLKFNIICHSQGCPDSRYMLTAVRNEFSGELMYKHVVSWTSLAGANKGTSLADHALEKLMLCTTSHCKSNILDFVFGVDSFRKNHSLIVEGSESVIALSQKYMLVTTDMNCIPVTDQTCPPSFNKLYPLPEDPEYPILYQTFSTQIDDPTHPCFSNIRPLWKHIKRYEGNNDGYISVNSQQYITDGPDSSGRKTPVIPRWVSGSSKDPSKAHPGLDHMSFSSSKVPGIPNISCWGEDNSMYDFSRIEFFKNIVAELGSKGF